MNNLVPAVATRSRATSLSPGAPHLRRFDYADGSTPEVQTHVRRQLIAELKETQKQREDERVRREAQWEAVADNGLLPPTTSAATAGNATTTLSVQDVTKQFTDCIAKLSTLPIADATFAPKRFFG